MKKWLWVLFIGIIVSGFGVQAQAQVELQLGLLLDGSTSIAAADFALIIDALVQALEDATLIPRDGSVEITIVQFSGPNETARVEVSPTVITASSINSIIQTVRAIDQGSTDITGTTPLWTGIDRITEAMRGSSNFTTTVRQVINVTTDGEPALGGLSQSAANQRSLDARNRAVNLGIDEIDAEGIGRATTSQSFQNFLLSLVWPQPGVLISNGGAGAQFRPGFVTLVENFADFEEALINKLEAVVSGNGTGNGDGDGDGDGTGNGPGTGPGGRPIPFDTPMGTALLAGVLGMLMLAFRFKEQLGLGVRK